MTSGMIRASMRQRNFRSMAFSSGVNSAICTTSSWVISAFSPIASKSEMAWFVPAMV